MNNVNPNNPPPNPTGLNSDTLDWMLANILFLKRRLNALAGSGGSGSGDNIYNTDGTLTGDRTVNDDAHTLSFINVTGTSFTDADSNILFSVDTTILQSTIAGVQALILDPADGSYVIGDVGGAANSTTVYIDDIAQIITLFGGMATPNMQTYTAGGSVIMDNGVRGIYYDPASVEATATITLPAAPASGQEVLILFGGQVSGAMSPVVTALTIAPNTDQHIIGSTPNAATTDTYLAFKYRRGGAIWYRID